MNNAGKEQIDKEITALAAMSDDDIDTTEIPEVTDWSRAAVGRFYDPGKEHVIILVDNNIPTYSAVRFDEVDLVSLRRREPAALDDFFACVKALLRSKLGGQLDSPQAIENMCQKIFTGIQPFLAGAIRDPASLDSLVNSACDKVLSEFKARENPAAQTGAIEQKSAKRFGGFSRLSVRWRAVALAGLACSIGVLFMLLGHGTLHITPPDGTSVTNRGTKPNDHGGGTAFPEIAALSSYEQVAVGKALRSGNISTPSSLSDLREKLGALRHDSPDDKAFRVLEPTGEVVIDQRPLFRWQPLAEAVSYSLVIFDTKGNHVQTSPAIHSTSWKPTHALQRGQVYQWQVTAVMGDGKSVITPSLSKPEAKFRVLDQAKADELTRFQQAHPDSHLVLGILSAEAGLLKDAEHELGEVQQSDRNFELAQNLLRGVRELREGP